MRNAVPFLLLACSAAMTAQAGKPSSISFNVTVNPTQAYASPGTSTVIQSDGAGTYQDGQEGVCASLAATGILTVDLECAAAPQPRRLTFATFPSAPLAPTSSGNYGCGASASTFTPPYRSHWSAAPASGGTPFQSMVVDNTGNTVYTVQLWFAIQFTTTSGTTAYHLVYDYRTCSPTAR